MCGIAGLIEQQQSEGTIKDILDRMIDAATWREPDGKGIYVNDSRNYTVGMAHRRLSIFDLSERGKQPMTLSDGRYALTYNGEIYNYKVIKEELIERGHVFFSDCDTEVVLHACVEFGVEKAVAKFNGMWAFAFYDRDAGTITLSRDRLGVKPLYYIFAQDCFAFASDMRSFFSLPGFDTTLNQSALHGYLWNMYIPAPYSIFDKVFKLPQGSILEYHIYEKRKTIRKYWDIGSIQVDFKGSYEEYVNTIEKLLSESVAIRLAADVPVGMFLSGGIDSSVITSLAQKQSTKILNTYSIGFFDKENDDAKVALEVAKILGTNHQELYCTQKDALALIQKIPEAYSEPFADNSQIPTMLLSQMTREHVTVALSGDGGDEFFIGYPSYASNRKLLLYRKLTRISDPLLRLISSRINKYDHKKWMIDKFLHAKDIASIIHLNYLTANELINSILPVDLSSRENMRIYGGEDHLPKGTGIVRSAVLQSIQYGLPDDMLTKVDRASMYYSLECRCPILDYRVAECALSVPNSYNLHAGILKAPLKDILYRYVPQEVVERPKSGFGVPINKWLHGELKEIVNDHLSDQKIKRQGIFDPVGMQKFTEEFNRQSNPILDRVAYTMLIFQLWWETYLDNGKAGQKI